MTQPGTSLRQIISQVPGTAARLRRAGLLHLRRNTSPRCRRQAARARLQAAGYRLPDHAQAETDPLEVFRAVATIGRTPRPPPSSS